MWKPSEGLSSRNRPWRELLHEPLERRELLAGNSLEELPVIISEFMADNNLSLVTRTRSTEAEIFNGDYKAPDWVELMNVSTLPIDLGGMHLSDDATQLNKWQFPAGTRLDSGEQLIVFASGQNLTNPSLDENGFLHTNFRLSSAGEFLGLSNHDGKLLHAYQPDPPAQQTDISYGISMETGTLIGPDSSLEYFVPANDALGSRWLQTTFSDTDLLTSAIGPIGFDRSPVHSELAETVGADLVARRSANHGTGTITILEYAPFRHSGRVTEWSFYSENDHSITPLVVRQAGDEFEIVGIGRTRTSNSSGVQEFAFDLQSGSDLVEEEQYFFGYKDGDNETDTSGVIMWNTSSDIARQYRGPQSGNMRLGQPLVEGRDVSRTFSIQATTASRIAGIKTDIGTQMQESSSLYARYPFDAPTRDKLRSMTLHIRYEDGFRATLNGTEIARRNAPDSARFDSNANQNRTLVEANRFEEINVSPFLDTLTDENNILAIHALNDDPSSDDFVLDVRLSGIEIEPLATIGFCAKPTPGEPNHPTALGIATPPTFSVSRGLFDQPFTLELVSEDDASAIIYYTRDGSPPTIDNPGTIEYRQPIPIEGTTVIRATRHRKGFLTSPIQSHTFIFPSDVANQENLKTHISEDPIWGPQIPAALRSLPTVSIATSAKVISEAELPASMELIFPDDTPGFQIDSGLEAFGRSSLTFEKKSLRLSFKELYGPPKLNFDLFDDPTGITEFDQILLRSGSHDSAIWESKASYIRNRWMSDRQIEMGQPAPRGRFVHVYQNGEYRGLYEMMERPNSSFMASHLGGSDDEYDVINAGDIVDGDDQAWNSLIESIGGDYEQVLEYLDEENFADYLLLQFYGGNNGDWLPHQNWLTSRRRQPGSGFQFFAWDSDGVLASGAKATIVNEDGPDHIWSVRGGVRQYEDFLRVLGDRSVKFFGEEKMFSAERVRGDIEKLAADIRLAIIAESARWGRRTFTPTAWSETIEWMKDTYGPTDGPSRGEIVLGQLRDANLIPEIRSPQFIVDGEALHDELVSAGVDLAMSAGEHPIFYTLDGTDPRQATPTIRYSAFIPKSANARVTVPLDNSLGNRWLATDFDDSSWTAGPTGVGFDTSGLLNEHIGFDILDSMKSVNTSAYLRIPFQVQEPISFDTLKLDLYFDDGFVAYLNGVEVKRVNAPELMSWDARATTSRRSVAATLKTFNLSEHVNLLRTGDNVLAIHALNRTRGGNDLLISPQLYGGSVLDNGQAPTATQYSEPFVVPANGTIKARTFGGGWSSLREVTSPRPRSPLRISEVMYHPAVATPAEVSAGFDDADDFEFLEIVNPSSESIDLTKVQFVQTIDNGISQGIEFDFGDHNFSELGPDQRALLVENESAFRFRYGPDLPVAGQWRGGLNNDSEQITLLVDNQLLQQFSYHDEWYASTDGQGKSLEIIDESQTELKVWKTRNAWLPSHKMGGTPGTGAIDRLFGDANRDGVFDAQDLIEVFKNGEYQDDIMGNSTFDEGDWNQDGDFDSSDLVFAFQTGSYLDAPSPLDSRMAAAVEWLFELEEPPKIRQKFAT
ncbi:MAG: hypothetical protein GY768_29445 [Planctomycetaceae bacterium]|nr:hypothetical protein [Planctomycetaceae bacterium]